MKCVKCGADLEEGAKFCGNCGSTVEEVAETPAEETVETQEVEPTIEQPEVEQPALEVEFPTEVSTESQVERQEIVQEPIPVDTPEFKKKQEEGKKSTGAVKVILVIISILAILAVVVFAFFKLKDGKETYNDSVDTVQKSLENLAKDANNSGTIKAKLEVDVKNSISATLGASFEFEKINENYKMHISVDKNMFIDQVDAYVDVDETKATVYIPSTLLSLIDSSMDTGNKNSWFKYTMDRDELGIDDLEESSNENDLDLSKVLNSDNFKYVGKKNGLKQYTLTIDKNYMNSVEDLKEYAEEIGDMKFDVNFYINSSDKLSKIEMDLAAAMKEYSEDVDKLLLTIEFTNYNSTKVTIPDNIVKSSIDLTSYVGDTTIPTTSLF